MSTSIRMQDLEHEVLRSDILRLTLLMVLFLFLSLYIVVMVYFFPATFYTVFARKLTFWLPLGFSLLIALYFYLLRLLYKRALERSTPIHKSVSYFSLFIETSIPTVILYITVQSHPLMYVIISPRILIYFFFILLSALTLDRLLCIFSGLVAALEYSILCFYLYFQYQPINLAHYCFDPTFIQERSILSFIVSRAGMFFVGGCVMAFITQQIKNRLFAAFEATKQREHIAQIFGRHVSPEVVNMLLHSNKKLVSESKKVCVLFLDIRGFTSFSENKKPEDVVNFLNYLFGFMVDIINAHHGIINKFLGDGFMAVFGAPISNAHATDNAVRAAVEIAQRVELEITNGAIPATRIGIGIHYGTVVTGTVGTSQRQEYTVIGDVVNLASRIEKLNKVYQSQVLISEDVYMMLEEKRGTLLGEVSVVGRNHPINIYQVL